ILGLLLMAALLGFAALVWLYLSRSKQGQESETHQWMLRRQMEEQAESQPASHDRPPSPRSVRCPTCGIELPPGTEPGACPGCLLRVAIEPATAVPEPGALPTAAHVPGVTAPAANELAAHFPQLEILELLGKGGMGAVYKARQPHLD